MKTVSLNLTVDDDNASVAEDMLFRCATNTDLKSIAALMESYPIPVHCISVDRANAPGKSEETPEESQANQIVANRDALAKILEQKWGLYYVAEAVHSHLFDIYQKQLAELAKDFAENPADYVKSVADGQVSLSVDAEMQQTAQVLETAFATMQRVERDIKCDWVDCQPYLHRARMYKSSNGGNTRRRAVFVSCG